MKATGFMCVTVVALLAVGTAAFSADATGSQPDEIFGRLDTNKDGTLTADEVGEEKAKFFRRLVRIGDADENGQLSRDEFDNALKKSGKRENNSGKPAARPQRERGPRADFDPERVFGFLDQNKDGKISHDELPERAKERMGRLFDRLGKDELTKEEFLEISAKRRKRFEEGDGPKDRRAKEPGSDEGKRPGPPDKGEGPPRRRFGEQAGRGPRGSGGKGGGRGRGAGYGPPVPALIRLIDTNHDHQLSKEELAAAVDKFDELDKNQDGSLDLREILGRPPQRRGPGKERAEGPSPRQGKGKKRKQGRGVGKNVGGRKRGGPKGQSKPGQKKAGGPAAEKVFKRLDADEDGGISAEEAPQRLKKRFEKSDADGDGQLSLEEFKSHFKKRGRRGPGKRGSPKDGPGKPAEE